MARFKTVTATSGRPELAQAWALIGILDEVKAIRVEQRRQCGERLVLTRREREHRIAEHQRSFGARLEPVDPFLELALLREQRRKR